MRFLDLFDKWSLLLICSSLLPGLCTTNVCMFFEGESENRIWYGIVLLSTNLGFLLQICEDFTPYICYAAESLLIYIKSRYESSWPGHGASRTHLPRPLQGWEDGRNWNLLRKLLLKSTPSLNLRERHTSKSGYKVLITLVSEIIMLGKWWLPKRSWTTAGILSQIYKSLDSVL